MLRRVAVAVAIVAALPAASAAVPAPTATIRLEHRIDNSRGFYTEGAFYYAALRGAGVSVVRRFSGSRMTLRMPAGRYTLRSYARTCDGTCSRIDPPADGCAARIRLSAGTTTPVRIVAPPGSPCRIRIVG